MPKVKVNGKVKHLPYTAAGRKEAMMMKRKEMMMKEKKMKKMMK